MGLCGNFTNDINMEYTHYRLEGFGEIIATFSLVLANAQGLFQF